jgi:hypothetical protein
MGGDHEFVRIETLVRQLARLLTGQPSARTGAALADLTAIWIKGHVVPDDPPATDRGREELLAFQVETIRKLLALPD